ncbi:hypothetical protein CRM22_010658 [Opisthorchis felineus]|uniref:Uncharacterized protein n=1 Tax=Opisthorchis felineus TaxID=147828 RepID=A0A4V3SBC2_OPIFE|nr:hypothetical protein CRM22_010658 [Opisthorchis felineus]TGZ52305.1 hypothetical protein CRM22_010658 [Opisthorchis felineus]TGZ52306.1 hypothetical protein CRM22_010658 [Opisthorchis felineus]
MWLEAEMEELIEIYRCGHSLRGACNEYHRRHPSRRKPTHRYLTQLLKRCQETGSVAHRSRKGSSPRDAELRLVVANMARDKPSMTNLELAEHFGVSRAFVGRTLMLYGIKRHTWDIIQRFTEDARKSRLQFCQWYLGKLPETPTMANDILFADEAVFNLHGVVNHHHIVQYSSVRSQVSVDDHHQYNLKLLVWCGLHNRTLVGPYFFDGSFNAQRLVDCFSTVVSPYLNSLADDVRDRIYFLHDTVNPHCAVMVKSWLDSHFPQHWIGKGGLFEWPTRSPDLNPMTFFLWDYLGSKVYGPPPKKLEELRTNIRTACASLDSVRLGEVSSSLSRRISECLENGGGTLDRPRKD